MAATRTRAGLHRPDAPLAARIPLAGGDGAPFAVPAVVARWAVLAVPAVLAAAVVLAFPAPGTAQVRYEVSFPDAEHHEAHIVATFEGVPPGPFQVRMSRSSPGRYALHEFAKNVYDVRASDGAGRLLDTTRPDPHTWTVHRHDGTVRVAYTLYADHADGTYSGVDETHAHLNMPSAFLWAPGKEADPVTVAFRVPEGSGWRVATQLAPTDDPFTFTAPDLAYFLDSPAEVSAFEERSWTITEGGRGEGNAVQGGREHREASIRLVVHHEGGAAEVDAYAQRVREVVEEQRAIFGELPRFDYGVYTFLADYLPWVYGDGMEHRNSTVLTSPSSLAAAAPRLLGTVSHEFFHAWNVERLRPASLEPFDFTRANMSGELWFAEGFTSYYDDLVLRRVGVLDDAAYAAGLSQGLSQILNSPARALRSPVEMSHQAPFVDAATSVDRTNRENTFLSYYTYGSVLGLGLDLLIRSRYPGRSLDDWMRALWQRFGRSESPYTLGDLRRVLGEVTDDAFAGDFFARHVHDSELPPFEELLGYAGFLLRRASPGEASLGTASFRTEDRSLVVTGNPWRGSPLHAAGVGPRDRLLSLDGEPLSTAEDLAAALGRRRPGVRALLEWESRGRVQRAEVVLVEDPTVEVVPYEAAGLPLTPEARRFRSDWLGSKVEGSQPG